jgi:octaprenyl-diphosphate synthase
LPDPPARARTYQEVVARFAPDLAAIEEQILANLGSRNELLEAMAAHVVRSGGKRLRPLLVIVCARMSGYGADGHVPLGNAVEYLHAATLMHDDVLDEAALRRGAPSANAVWGNHLAVLGGDFLYTTAFDILLRSAPRPVIRALSRCSLELIEGEVLQRRWRSRPDLEEATYLRIVECKTASLISACCRTGAMLAGVDDARVEALAAYGRHLGLAFQIIDDTLDYFADQRRLGKVIGGDLRQGTVTLPLILLLAEPGLGPEQERIRGEVAAGALDDAAIARISALMLARGCRERALARAREHAAAARAALAPLAGSELHAALLAAAAYVTERDS